MINECERSRNGPENKISPAGRLLRVRQSLQELTTERGREMTRLVGPF